MIDVNYAIDVIVIDRNNQIDHVIDVNSVIDVLYVIDVNNANKGTV